MKDRHAKNLLVNAFCGTCFLSITVVAKMKLRRALRIRAGRRAGRARAGAPELDLPERLSLWCV
eukprot:1656202-Amphidinium_carterae.1